MIDFFIEIDRWLFLFINSLNNIFFDWLMFHISEKTTWIPLYLFIIVLVYRKFKWQGLIFLVFAGLLILLSDQSSVFIKKSFMRLRPCHEPSLEGLVHLVRGKCGGRFGFVSSHAANTFALAVFVNGILRKHYRFIVPMMLIYAFLNAYSRVYLGVHYPGDVIFGAILGAGIAFALLAIWSRIVRPVKSIT